MATIRITSNNYNNQGANITFYSENNPDIPVNLGLNVIPYVRSGSDIFGRYVLSFPAFGSVCEASIFSPTTTTTPDPSTPTTTPDPSITTTTIAPLGTFSITHDSTSQIVIEFLSGSIGNIDFGDGDERVFSTDNILTKNYQPINNSITRALSVLEDFGSSSYYRDSQLFSDCCMDNSGSLIIISTRKQGNLNQFQNIGVRNGGLYINKSYHSTFTNLDVTSATCSNDGNNILACVFSSRTYLSTNGGTSFTPTDNTSRLWSKVRLSNDGSFAVGIVASEKIYTSENGGIDWTPRESNRDWKDIAIASQGNKIVAVGYNTNIYISTDAGLNWTTRESIRSWEGVAISDDGLKIIACASNQLYLSNDGGINWTSPYLNNLSTFNSVSISGDGNTIVANTSSATYISYDSGITWSNKPMTNWGYKNNLKGFISKNKNKLVVLQSISSDESFSYYTVPTAVYTFLSNNNIDYREYNIDLKTINISGQYNFKFKTYSNGFTNINSGGIFQSPNSETNSSLIKLNNWGSVANLTDLFANSVVNNDVSTVGCLGLNNVPVPPNLVNINGVFDKCISINQDFTGWNINAITNGTLDRLLRGTKLSNTNYNKLLQYFNINKNSFRNDIVINFGGAFSDTTSGGINGNNAKIGLITYGWIITDGAGTFSL